MISLFKDKSAGSVFWLVIICFGLHINSLLNPPAVIVKPEDGYFYFFLSPLLNAQPYFASLLFILMIFLLALQLNFMLNALRMYPRQTNTAALAFLLFTSLLPIFNTLSTALFTSNIFIWILYSACRLYGAPSPKTAIYNLGMLCGICILLYFPSLPLVVIALLALIIMRPFRPNELFVLFFGIITPFYFLGTYLYLTNQLALLPSPANIFGIFTLPVPPVNVIVTYAIATLMVLWGIFSVQASGVNVLIQVRKSWMVFFVALALLLPVIFFINGAYPLILLLVVIPASAYAGYAFANSKNILPVLFFWLLIALSIYNNWFVQ